MFFCLQSFFAHMTHRGSRINLQSFAILSTIVFPKVHSQSVFSNLTERTRKYSWINESLEPNQNNKRKTTSSFFLFFFCTKTLKFPFFWKPESRRIKEFLLDEQKQRRFCVLLHTKKLLTFVFQILFLFLLQRNFRKFCGCLLNGTLKEDCALNYLFGTE